MKIRLIQPAQLDEQGVPTKFSKLFFPNLTLPTIAALTPTGIDTNITMEYVEDVDFDEDGSKDFTATIVIEVELTKQ